MKILFYSDLHASFANPDYMDRLYRSLGFLEEVIRERKPDILVHLGDNTDTFGTVDVKSLIWVYRWVNRLGELMKEDKGCQWILSGNHDVSDAACEYSTAELMFNKAHTAVFTKPTIVDLPYESTGIAVFPYTKDLDSVREMLPKVKGCLAAFGHVEWAGVRMTPTFVSKDGLSVTEYQKITGGVPFFQGHYHMPSEEGSLFVVGSPLYKDFTDAESDIPRGFTLFDSDQGLVTRIENPHTYYTKKILAETEDELKTALSDMGDRLSDTKIRVHVPSSLVEMAEKLFVGALSLAVHPTDTIRTGLDHVTKVSLTTSVHEVIQKAVETAPDGYDRKLLDTYGKEVFHG